jgi:hypothetical protein
MSFSSFCSKFCSFVAFCSKSLATLFRLILRIKVVEYKVVSKNIFFFLYSVASVARLLTSHFQSTLLFKIYTLEACYKCYMLQNRVLTIYLLGFLGLAFCYRFATDCYSFFYEVIYV